MEDKDLLLLTGYERVTYLLGNILSEIAFSDDYDPDTSVDKDGKELMLHGVYELKNDKGDKVIIGRLDSINLEKRMCELTVVNLRRDREDGNTFMKISLKLDTMKHATLLMPPMK